MVVLQGQGSAQMERLVYGDSEQLIREYMLRNGQRLLDFFKGLPGLDFSREIAASAFGQAVRELPGLAAATQDEVEATWKRLCSHSGVKSRLTESGLREHLRKTGKRVVELFADLDIEARREEGRGLSRDDFGRAVRMLGFVDATDDEVDATWANLDANSDGQLELRELDRRLMNTRHSGGAVPEKEEGADIYGGRNFEAHAPKVYEWQKSLDALFERPFDASALVNYLKLTGKRVSDFFHALDADSSRAVSKAEFGRAVRRIGFARATDDEVNATWDLLDENGDEVLEMGELSEKLMEAFRVKPKPKPKLTGMAAKMAKFTPKGSEKHWDARHRTYKSSFNEALPQRPPNYGGTPASPAPQPGSQAFERSHAEVLGPGSYDPTFLTGPAANAKVGPDSGLSWVRNLNRMIYSTAPGASGSRWTEAAREPPYWHIKQRAYCITANGEPRHRDEGLDHIGIALDQNTIAKDVRSSPRKYAAQFDSQSPSRPPPGGGRHEGTPEGLGPGSYTVHEDVQCGGIKVFREQWRPSSMFAGRVGGKYANVGDTF